MPEPLPADVQDLLALHLVPGLGPRLTAALLELFGSARAVLKASSQELQRVPHIGAKLAQDLAVSLRTVDVAAEQIAQGLWALKDRLGLAEPAELRELIRSFVARVECRFRHVPYGRREKSILCGGTIYVKEEPGVIRVVPRGNPLITVTPARARSPASRSATRLP